LNKDVHQNERITIVFLSC